MLLKCELQSDKGAQPLSGQRVYTTFVKARITCDSGLPDTFFYDRLEDTYYSSQEQMLYGVFNTAR